jgi:hypothetical protein
MAPFVIARAKKRHSPYLAVRGQSHFASIAGKWHTRQAAKLIACGPSDLE